MVRTYYCGGLGLVKRLDDFIGPWIDLSIPGVKVLYDIETDPLDGDHVVVVGEAGRIFVSTNAGSTWDIPTGNYNAFTPIPNFYEVFFTDSNTIYVVGGGGACVVSLDGGLTFNSTASLPTPTGLYLPAGGDAFCVHFPTPLMGVVGFQDKIFKTIDGGATWIYTNGGLPVNTPQGPLHFRGIELSSNGLTITAWGESCVYRSTDGGLSYLLVLDFIYVGFSGRPGEHLTWINDNTLWGTTRQNEIFKSINAGSSWTSLRTPDTSSIDIARIRAAHFYDNTNGFYSVNNEIFSTADSGATGTLSDSQQQEIWAVWTHLGQPCYLLTPCTGGFGFITNTDLSLYVGGVVTLIGGTICYQVELSNDCTGATPVTVDQSFIDCDACAPKSCYFLTPCDGRSPSHAVTGTFIPGSVVHVDLFPGICYIVSDLITPCDIGVPAVVTQTFDDCECCLPPPVPPPNPPETQSVDPYNKASYRLTDDQCTIETNEAFCDAYYELFKTLKYGIKTCTSRNLDNLWIQKTLLDIRSLAIDIPCCTPVSLPCCPEPVLCVYPTPLP